MKYEENKTVKRLRELGVTKQFIADKLGINLNRLNNIIYGRIVNQSANLELQKLILKLEKQFKK